MLITDRDNIQCLEKYMMHWGVQAQSFIIFLKTQIEYQFLVNE